MKRFALSLLVPALVVGRVAADETFAPETAARHEAAGEPQAELAPPRLTAPERIQPAEAIWAMHRPTPPRAGIPSGSRAGLPTGNQRYAPPAGPAPQVGYAPQTLPPLPGYPGIAPTAGGQPGFPSRTTGTGALASLFTDLKACGPGDVLTIIISQQAVAAANANKNSQRDVKIGFDGGAGLLSFLPSFGLTYQGGANGKTNDTSSFNVATTFTVVVTEVAANGNLLVEGQQVVEMDGRPQWVKLSGEVRPYDVNPNNTIESTKVANVHIEFVGTRARERRRGLLEVIGGAIESLFGIFF